MSERLNLNPPDGCSLRKMQDKTELLLDLDTPHAIQQFLRVLPLVERYLGVGHIRIWPSRHNVHAAIQLEMNFLGYSNCPLCSAHHEDSYYLMLFFFQAILGSDPVREILNLAECRYENSEPQQVNVLFKPDWKAIADEADNSQPTGTGSSEESS